MTSYWPNPNTPVILTLPDWEHCKVATRRALHAERVHMGSRRPISDGSARRARERPRERNPMRAFDFSRAHLDSITTQTPPLENRNRKSTLRDTRGRLTNWQKMIFDTVLDLFQTIWRWVETEIIRPIEVLVSCFFFAL